MGLHYKSNKIKNNICDKTKKPKNVCGMKKPNIERWQWIPPKFDQKYLRNWFCDYNKRLVKIKKREGYSYSFTEIEIRRSWMNLWACLSVSCFSSFYIPYTPHCNLFLDIYYVFFVFNLGKNKISIFLFLQKIQLLFSFNFCWFVLDILKKKTHFCHICWVMLTYVIRDYIFVQVVRAHTI